MGLDWGGLLVGREKELGGLYKGGSGLIQYQLEGTPGGQANVAGQYMQYMGLLSLWSCMF